MKLDLCLKIFPWLGHFSCRHVIEDPAAELLEPGFAVLVLTLACKDEAEEGTSEGYSSSDINSSVKSGWVAEILKID